MKKRGQFYLIAAIIIIVIIFGIYTAGNYVKTEKEDTIVYDLKKEFGLESGKVDDFLTYNRQESTEYMESWIETYVENKGQSLDNFIVVYGNETSLTMENWGQDSSGTICIGGTNCRENNRLARNITRVPRSSVAGNKFQIMVGNSTYNFDLESGKNFILIIKEGRFVAA